MRSTTRRLAWLVVLVTCASTSWDVHAAFNRPQAGRADWHLGGRYDDTRIVMMLGGEINMPQSEAHALQPAFTATRAQFFGPVNELSAARAGEIVHDAAHVGDRWVLDAGRFGWFHAATRFAAAATTSSAGPIAFSPSTEQRATLERLLNEEFRRRWPKVHAEAMRSHAGFDGQRLWPTAWASIDRRIESGEPKLTYDVQSFRLTPDGEPRLFVHASWKLGSQVVFLMTAWARAGSTLTLDYVDVNVSRNRGYSDFPSSPSDIAELNGLILSVLDTDRNGWGEFTLVRRDSAHDGMSIDVLEYPQAAGQELRVILSVNLGC
jgi:hypothetical protein